MILMNDIVIDPADVLRHDANKIDFPVSDDIRQLAQDMMGYLENSQDDELAKKYNLRPGIGLAATQLDKPIQMTAILIPKYVETEDGIVEADEPEFKGIVINPEIISESAQRAALASGEGCLSVPEDIEGFVARAQRITVRYQDLDGNTHEIKLRDYPAIVFQHEIDHFHGKLYYDYINQLDPWHQDNNTKYID